MRRSIPALFDAFRILAIIRELLVNMSAGYFLPHVIPPTKEAQFMTTLGLMRLK